MPQRLEQFATFFGLAFSALLPLVNPLGSALVFVSLVGDAPAAVYRSLARKVAINTTLFFLVIQIIGTAVLKFSAFHSRLSRWPAALRSPRWAGNC